MASEYFWFKIIRHFFSAFIVFWDYIQHSCVIIEHLNV